MKTINGINQKVSQDQTINMYIHCGRDYDQYQNNWRNKYFNFRRRNESERLTNAGNFLYGAAMQRFYEIAGLPGYNYEKTHKRISFELFDVYNEYHITLYLEQDLNGVTLSIYETNFKPLEEILHKKFIVRSNKTFETFNAQQYFENKILKNYLFVPGLFRSIQFIFNCTREKALEHYKSLKGSIDNTVDVDKGIKNRLLKHFNVKIGDYIPEKILLKWMQTNSRQKTRKLLFKSPNFFDLSDDYTRQYDTEDHMEEFIDDIFSDYPKNSIFI